jgi:hypothetical protein
MLLYDVGFLSSVASLSTAIFNSVTSLSNQYGLIVIP